MQNIVTVVSFLIFTDSILAILRRSTSFINTDAKELINAFQTYSSNMLDEIAKEASQTCQILEQCYSHNDHSKSFDLS